MATTTTIDFVPNANDTGYLVYAPSGRWLLILRPAPFRPIWMSRDVEFHDREWNLFVGDVHTPLAHAKRRMDLIPTIETWLESH